ncbi:hypothetical protein RRG08_015179 [Elysia crispata]|uniref:Uncharacterized protein n=1 Tax=Elysia crispata TaxID=231223 RepID=A0AAE1CW03_9GAST|nr:hypothetical protein RRG08_015179 [Elysia crispata]KAK3738979.1 hypothetical protein RRG08_015179 [Elysia crispata]
MHTHTQPARQISAFNAKAKGKFFTHGFDVAVCINYDDGRVVKLSSRNYGTADNGVYRFVREGTMDEFLPDGPWGDDRIYYRDRQNGIRVEITENNYNNQLVYDFRRCGVTVTFVPYDLTARRDQKSIPGLSVAINCAMHPQWLSPNKVMGLSPVMGGGSYFRDLRMPGMNDEQSMVVRAFTRGFAQNQPYDDDGRCEATSSTFATCSPSERRMAIDNCYWIMKQPRFVRCFDRSRSAKNVLKLFASCVDMWCDNGSCADVQKAIRDSGCSDVPRIPQLPMFMAGSMCPP